MSSQTLSAEFRTSTSLTNHASSAILSFASSQIAAASFATFQISALPSQTFTPLPLNTPPTPFLVYKAEIGVGTVIGVEILAVLCCIGILLQREQAHSVLSSHQTERT